MCLDELTATLGAEDSIYTTMIQEDILIIVYMYALLDGHLQEYMYIGYLYMTEVGSRVKYQGSQPHRAGKQPKYCFDYDLQLAEGNMALNGFNITHGFFE